MGLFWLWFLSEAITSEWIPPRKAQKISTENENHEFLKEKGKHLKLKGQKER